MPKRTKGNRATPATYVHYGKPEEVRIERVDYGGGKRGVRSVTWVETLSGVSLDSRKAHDVEVDKHEKAGGSWHPNGCAGQAGVGALYWRGGQGYCAADYELRFAVSPFFDDLLEDPPPNWKRPR